MQPKCLNSSNFTLTVPFPYLPPTYLEFAARLGFARSWVRATETGVVAFGDRRGWRDPVVRPCNESSLFSNEPVDSSFLMSRAQAVF